jgi:hypothetical protein
MVTARFHTRWMVLLISMFLLSACGGNDSTTSTSLTSEGAVDNPTSLPNINSATANSGQVGNKAAGKSYYTANVSTGTTYTITLYGLSADADLLVYNDLPFDYVTGPVCASRNGVTANEQCVVKANSSTMNIEVDGQYSSLGATYFISVNYPVAAAACSSGTGTCIDFEGTPPTFTYSGTGTQWIIDTSDSFTVTHSIHSTGLTDSQTSCFSYTTTTSTNSYVSFNLKTNSTPNYDLLLFYIDDVLQLPVWSDIISWQNVMFNTTTGTHTYKWCHSNHYINFNPLTPASGDVWVDDIYIQ